MENEVESDALRPMNCELNNISNPDGSSIFMQGETSVITGIYGPVEGKLHKMCYDKANIEVVYSSARGPTSINDRLMECYISDTFEAALLLALHPGSSICINIQELQDSGGLLACAINGACLALINSSLSMKYTVAAVNCMVEKDSDKIIIDPNSTQLENARATFTCAFDSLKKDLTCCNTTGRFSEAEYIQAVNKCKEASTHIFTFYRDIVKKYANLI